MDCVSARVGVTVSPFLGCLEIAESGQRGVVRGRGVAGWAEVLWKDSAALANTHSRADLCGPRNVSCAL